MKNMKSNLIGSLANACMDVGENAAGAYSLFLSWYEPKISPSLLKKQSSKTIKNIP